MSRRRTEPLVCIIRDPSNAHLDYFLSASDARILYTQGIIQYDATNGCYALPSNRSILTLSPSSYTRTSQQ